jgi:regulator of RNase E activity RraA
MMANVSETLLVELQQFDTPTICNALEELAGHRLGHGYTTRHLICIRPGLKPMVGFARTATIRSTHPNDLPADAARDVSNGYYAYIDAGPKPSVIVMQDLDEPAGYGSFWGEVNSAIHKGFGAQGVVTNGSVRDLPDTAEGFQMLAGSVGPSHAHVHVVDFGRSVNVAGMRVRDGDLIHADQHGAVVIPHEAAAGIGAAVRLIQARERVTIEAARQPGFNAEKLRAARGEAAKLH